MRPVLSTSGDDLTSEESWPALEIKKVLGLLSLRSRFLGRSCGLKHPGLCREHNSIIGRPNATMQNSGQLTLMEARQ